MGNGEDIYLILPRLINLHAVFHQCVALVQIVCIITFQEKPHNMGELLFTSICVDNVYKVRDIREAPLH